MSARTPLRPAPITKPPIPGRLPIPAIPRVPIGAPVLGPAMRATALAGLRGALRLSLGNPYLNLALFAWDLYQQGKAEIPAEPEHYNLSGWTRVENCNKVGGGSQRMSLFGGNCTTFNPQYTSGWNNPPTSSSTSIYEWSVEFNHPQGTFPNYYWSTYMGRWTRNAGTIGPPPLVPAVPAQPATPPVWGPSVNPALPPAPNSAPWLPLVDPLLMPVGAPMLHPNVKTPWSVVPRRHTNPYRSPSEQRQAENHPGTRTNPRQNLNNLPRIAHNPNVNPRLPPNVSLTATGVVTSPASHTRSPPTTNVKEKKLATLPATARVISKAFHNMTELCDGVDSLYEAIPANARLKYQKGGAITCLQKANHVYRNLDKVVWQDAMVNIVKNHYEDKLIGGLNAGVGKRTRRSGGLPVGLGFGPAM